VVALTANAFPEDIAAARAAGMQAHLAKPVVFAQLARVLQRWLPTRIVEADQLGTLPRGRPSTPAARASQLARSPQLVARWEKRRREAVEAVAAALAEGWLAAADLPPAPSDDLARLLHKLAGTAAMFGEPGLGEAAGALERALTTAATSSARATLAQALLASAGDEGDGARALG
jgi:CheY-like chemotaxis protein